MVNFIKNGDAVLMTMNVDLQKWKTRTLRIAEHVLFWMLVLAAYVFLYGHRGQAYISILYILLLTLPVYLAATYFTLYYLIPQFLLKKDYRRFAIYFIYTSLFSVFLEVLIIIYGVVMMIPPDNGWFRPVDPASIDIYFLIAGIYGVVLLAAVIKLLKHWYAGQRKQQEITKEKLEAELKFLKSQIHPHFLFNTLNNLYALTLKKSDQAPEVVMKLSELLDYLLYKGDLQRISLEKELHLLDNYLALEKLRCGERLDVSVHVRGNTDDKQIAPMLILPFVENCFKHGVNAGIEKAWVHVDLALDEAWMNLEVENSKSPGTPVSEKSGGSGIGLKNVRRRLDLVYPGQYELETRDLGNSYRVRLSLNLEP